MTKSRKEELSEKADEERRRCRDWLFKFMHANQPKFLTKAELHQAAMRELKISKNSFDIGWICAVNANRTAPSPRLRMRREGSRLISPS
jgi:hypothetical protein